MYTEKVIPKAIIKICKLEKTSKKKTKKNKDEWLLMITEQKRKFEKCGVYAVKTFFLKKKLNKEKVNP